MNVEDQVKMDAVADGSSSWIMSILTSKLFIFNCVFAWGWLYLAKQSIKPLIQKTDAHRARDKKFAAFQRMDLEKLASSWSYYFWFPTTFLRLFIPYFSIFLMMIFTWVASFFKSRDNNFEGFSFKIIRCFQMFTSRAALFSCGIFRWETEFVEYDYRKYLGPDWKPDKNKKPTVIISNHQSWLDIMVNMYYQSPSHVAKEGTKRIPFVGPCATMFGCLYVTRDNKQSKGNMYTQISERQSLIEQGKYPPIIFNVEGGTSNGKQLLQFKKGGFFSLKSVRPQIIKYHSHNLDLENCIIKIQSIACFMCSTSISFRKKVHVKKLPVFEPNDWFFQNHQQEGEEKWQTFARVIRDIMAEVGNLEKSDLQIEDKFEYKRQLYPSNKDKSITD